MTTRGRRGAGAHNDGGVLIPPYNRRGRVAPAKAAHKINHKIDAREVRVIGADGKQLGVMPTHIARRIAEEKGLDLVEINPKGQPPVCKIVDYGRFKYEESKRKRAGKKRQSTVQVKEVKLRPKTSGHDIDVKVRAVQRFLEEGNKAKLVIQFRGREIVHPETGRAMLTKVLMALGDRVVVEQMPIMEGRRMIMVIAPKPGSAGKGGGRAARKPAEKPAPPAAKAAEPATEPSQGPEEPAAEAPASGTAQPPDATASAVT